ncbi:hypothetical protein [Bartonella sp. CB175]|uniref:hypothetical protein n=1 Tax=Bartonella sp. CB175 TaxID=3112256 RepID=UPI00300E0463
MRLIAIISPFLNILPLVHLLIETHIISGNTGFLRAAFLLLVVLSTLASRFGGLKCSGGRERKKNEPRKI